MTALRIRHRHAFLTLHIPDGWDYWTYQGTEYRKRTTDDGSQVIESLEFHGWQSVQVLEIAA